MVERTVTSTVEIDALVETVFDYAEDRPDPPDLPLGGRFSAGGGVRLSASRKTSLTARS
jgi:hypothetical protein